MKRRFLAVLVVLAMGYAVSTAAARPKNLNTAKEDKAATPVQEKGQSPCHGGKTISTKVDDGRSETTAKVKKGGCNKPCGHKGAKTVSADASPCSGKCGKDCKKDCCKKGDKTVSAKDSDCPISKKVEAILASMPTMKFRVGDDVTCCSKSAAALAEKSGKPLQFVVGESTFDTKGEAMASLAKVLEEEVVGMQTVQYVANGKCGRCPMTAKSAAKSTGTKVTYRVGGADFESKEEAQKVAKLVADSLGAVRMTYKVDGKTFHCDKMAGEKCKKSGKKMIYVVGDEETGCETTAKLNQAKAKFRKIVETAVTASLSL